MKATKSSTTQSMTKELVTVANTEKVLAGVMALLHDEAAKKMRQRGNDHALRIIAAGLELRHHISPNHDAFMLAALLIVERLQTSEERSHAA